MELLRCQPLLSNAELLDFIANPAKWGNLVEPLQSRSVLRKLGAAFETITFREEICCDPEQRQKGRPQVLVCHDLANNYKDDSFVNGSPKWDYYRFYNWAGIDVFCYFSHNYVTIPTLAWINAAHRHGVKVIGTVIFEFAQGAIVLEEVLQSEEFMHQVVAALVLIAVVCKFDGWLLNVECTLRPEKIPLLRTFAEHLTSAVHTAIPHGLVYWYDSIITSGVLVWQNELNAANGPFFDVCDGILLNYGWTDENLRRSVEYTLRPEAERAQRQHDIFVGIDVFGRGQTAGFDTHRTLARIAGHQMSVGLFAPAWTFETMGQGIDVFAAHGTDACNGHFIERNDRFWRLLWPALDTHGTHRLPFYTAFSLGSGKFRNRFGASVSDRPWFDLSEQHWTMSVPTDGAVVRHNFERSLDGGSCLDIGPAGGRTLRLFVVDFASPHGLIVGYAFRATAYGGRADCEMLLHAVAGSRRKHCRIVLGERRASDERGEVGLRPLVDDDLRTALIGLHATRQKCLPATSPINGWTVRYFYVGFAAALTYRICDIGFRTVTAGGEDMRILLGGVAVHEGPADLAMRARLKQVQITDSDFI